jgi:hypothetical protein
VATQSGCGFCGRAGDEKCQPWIRRGAKALTWRMRSRCPLAHPIVYARAATSTVRSPCTNRPVLCFVCVPDVSGGWVRAVWLHDLPHHFAACHPTYSRPGWPAAKDGSHGALPDFIGDLVYRPDPALVTLDFGEAEEKSIGVSKGSKWTELTSSCADPPRAHTPPPAAPIQQGGALTPHNTPRKPRPRPTADQKEDSRSLGEPPRKRKRKTAPPARDSEFISRLIE